MDSVRRSIYSSVLILVALALTVALSGCEDFFVSGDALNSIAVSPTSIFLVIGESKQFGASGTTVNGETTDVASTAKWESSSSSVATVDSTGMVTAVGAGNTTITASKDGVNSSGNVIVNAHKLTTLDITPNLPSITAGSTIQLKATGTFEDNTVSDLTSFVAWTSGTSSVATVSSTGFVTGITAGTAQITVTVNTSTGTETGTVNVIVQ
jgi:trimeric autotransporter adhesin